MFCRLIEPIGVVSSADENVYVDGVRHLPTSEGSYAVREDSTLSIVCGFNGVASEDVTWTKDGSGLPFAGDDRLSVSSSAGSSTLTVSNVESADAGVYVCEGSRDGERISSSANITVTGPFDYKVLL